MSVMVNLHQLPTFKMETFQKIQTQLFVCSALYADFVLATFHSGNVNFSIQRIFQDEELIADTVALFF